MATENDLFNAIQSNDIREVKRLVEDDDGLTYTHDYDYSTPLMHATECAHLDMVRQLLDSDFCDIDEGDDQTWISPLIVASEKGYTEISRLLMEHGADVNRQYEKEDDDGTCEEQGYPLTVAVENEHMEIVRLLLEHGADPESIMWTYDGAWNTERTPLMLALQLNNFELAEILLELGADVDGECSIRSELHTPISYSVAKKKEDWASFLLKNGANIYREIDEGQTVLEYAKEIGCLKMLTT
ncbi:MAG: hypothetical protein B6240_12035 [Desulfobacteraceae bacterium 4572_87]|nr:MAG: hypothetical protein B6240_12035 [Desulfobacteraceae bacterium 4572_87]